MILHIIWLLNPKPLISATDITLHALKVIMGISGGPTGVLTQKLSSYLANENTPVLPANEANP